MTSPINRINNGTPAPVDLPSSQGGPRLGRSMGNPALSSRNAPPETSAGTRPRALPPASTAASPLSDGELVKWSASNTALLSAGKLENMPDELAGLSSADLKVQAFIVMTTMGELAKPEGVADLAGRLEKKFNTYISETGAVGHVNFKINQLLKALGDQPPGESIETLDKLSTASDIYANAMLGSNINIADTMKVATLHQNIAVQTARTNTHVGLAAKKSGQSAESIAARAVSIAVETLSKAGSPPTPEVIEAGRWLIKGETSQPPR